MGYRMLLQKSDVCTRVLKTLQSNWLWWITGLLVAFSRICWYGMLNPYKIFADSEEYIAFDTIAMLQGKPVNGRAPLYGMFLDILEFLFPAHFLSVAGAIQILVSVLSLFVLARLLLRIGVRSPWCQFCVLFYGVTPAVVGWDICILTESFSLSGAVVFFYFTVRYIQEHRLRDGILSNLTAVALLFLRPQFLVYLALLLVFYLLKLVFPHNEAERRTIFALLAVQLLCWGIILLYCAGVKKQFGIFSINDALPRQNLMVCVDRGYYTELDDSEIRDFVVKELENEEDPWNVCTQAVAIYGNERVDATTKRYFLAHFGKYFSDTVNVILGDLGSSFYGYAFNDSTGYNPEASRFFYTVYPIQKSLFQWVLVVHVLLVSVSEGFAMIIVWIKRRTLPWLHMALFSISVCTTFLTYFVTNTQYMRTMSSIMPYFVCMMGMFLQMCSEYASSRKHPAAV